MKKFFLLGILSIFSLALFVSAPVFADKYGLDDTATAADLTGAGTSVPVIVGNIVGTALSIISVIFFILMIYAGFLWMTAHGKEDQEKKARDTIFAAIIGIIIVLAAYAITTFVFSSVKGGGGSNSNGGGLNSGGGASPQKSAIELADETCKKNKDISWTCKNIDECLLGDTNAPNDAGSLDEKINYCKDEGKDYCSIGNCPGVAINIVCCI